MAHFGFLTLYLTGHLNPAMSLARALEERGHKVTFFNLSDVSQPIQENNFRFVQIGACDYPEGTLKQVLSTIATLQGQEAFQFFLNMMTTLARTSFRELPALIEQTGVDTLVVDQLFPGGATVAQHLRLPYASQANALAVNYSVRVPPPVLPGTFADNAQAEARNEETWRGVRGLFQPWQDTDNAQRKSWGLPMYDYVLDDSFSPFAQIAQQQASFDFPRKGLPSTFHYVGPLNHQGTRKEVPFHWEQLNNDPLVYASLGTMQNGQEWIFRIIMDACAELNAQIVLSLGGSVLNEEKLGVVPKNVLLVPYAPQFDVLARSNLCITHAGLNTALDSLTNGVPMIAIPIANDQFGVGARIEWTNTGKTISLADLTAECLHGKMSEFFRNSTYQTHAKDMQKQIDRLSPLDHACEILEHDVVGKCW